MCLSLATIVDAPEGHFTGLLAGRVGYNRTIVAVRGESWKRFGSRLPGAPPKELAGAQFGAMDGDPERNFPKPSD